MNWLKRLFAPKYKDQNGFQWVYEYPYWWLERSYHKNGKTYAYYLSVLDVDQTLDSTVRELIDRASESIEK